MLTGHLGFFHLTISPCTVSSANKRQVRIIRSANTSPEVAAAVLTQILVLRPQCLRGSLRIDGWDGKLHDFEEADQSNNRLCRS